MAEDNIEIVMHNEYAQAQQTHIIRTSSNGQATTNMSHQTMRTQTVHVDYGLLSIMKSERISVILTQQAIGIQSHPSTTTTSHDDSAQTRTKMQLVMRIRLDVHIRVCAVFCLPSIVTIRNHIFEVTHTLMNTTPLG